MAFKSFLLSATLLVAGASASTDLNLVKRNDVDYDVVDTLASFYPFEQQQQYTVTASTPAPTASPHDTRNAAQMERRAGPMRVMIVGDSMTQGKEGDWTWRYRMWDWMVNSQGLSVDFVGPYKGTRSPPSAEAPSPPPLYTTAKTQNDTIIASGGYAAGASPSFDSDHFAIWGRAAAEDVGTIQGFVQQAQPDVMLLMLGFNDLGWYFSDDDGLLFNIHTLIQNARAAAPNLKIAMANVPQRTSLGRTDLPRLTDSYNQKLSDAIPGWSTTQSPIHEVLLRENYNCELTGCPVGYDGLHPNAQGEYQIAQAFSKTLVNDFKIGSSPIVIPGNVPSRPVPVPSNFQVSSSIYGVTATWDAVYGAYGYNVKYSIDGGPWTTTTTQSNRFDTHWPFDGHTYAIQVNTGCGQDCAGAWTGAQSAKATPKAPSTPQNIKVSSSGTSITVTWDSPTNNGGGIIEYNVIYWDQSQPCSWIAGAAFAGNGGTINNLVAGHRYFIAVSAWSGNGEGFPAVGHSVIVGNQGKPGQPSNVVATSIDEFTAHLTWDEVTGAAGYALWTRDLKNPNSVLIQQNITRNVPCADVGLLAQGVENYEFCIEAFNGDQESLHANCQVPEKHTSGVAAAPSCAPPDPRQSTACPSSDGPGFSHPPPPPASSTTTMVPTSTPTPTRSSHMDTRGGMIRWSGPFLDASGHCGDGSKYKKCYKNDEAAATKMLYDQLSKGFDAICKDVSCDETLKYPIYFPRSGCDSNSLSKNEAYDMTIEAEYTFGDRDNIREAFINSVTTLNKKEYSCKTDDTPGVNTVSILIPQSMDIVSDAGNHTLGSFMNIAFAKSGPSTCDVIKALWATLGAGIEGGPIFGQIIAGMCK